MGRPIQLRGKAPMWQLGDHTASLRRYLDEVVATPKTTPEIALELSRDVVAARDALWLAILEDARMFVACLPVLQHAPPGDHKRQRRVDAFAKEGLVASLAVRARQLVASGSARARDRYARAVKLALERDIAWTDPDSVLIGVILEQLGRGELVAVPVRQAAVVRERAAALCKARNRATKASLRLVVAVATRTSRLGMGLEDIVAEGNLGLMKAVTRFDPRKGVKFSTYAIWWIRHAIRRAIADQGRLVRLPVHVIDVLYRVFVTQATLASRFGRPPEDAEVAAACGLTVERVQRLLRAGFWPLSLDTPLPGEDGESEDRPLMNIIPDERQGQDLDLEDRRRDELARALLREIDPRRAAIVRARVGMGCAEQTLQQIGAGLEISRERVRQIEAMAMGDLRKAAVTIRRRRQAERAV